MSLMQSALQSVGFKPTKKRKPTIVDVFNKVVGYNPSVLAAPRKIVVHRAGGFYKARFDGDRTACFGINPSEAIRNLKCLAKQ